MNAAEPRTDYPLDPKVRSRAMSLAIGQGVTATFGAWLAGGWILNFFAMELGAKGLMMGIILAIGNLVGLLRVVAPHFVNRSDNRKRVWLVAALLARVISAGLPLLAFPDFRPGGLPPLVLLIILLSGITIAATISDVAWLSWYADIVPESRWGRYFARRNAYMAVPIAVTTLLGGWAVSGYVAAHPEAKLLAYAALFSVGILLHLAALVVLLPVPNLPLRKRPEKAPGWREIAAPLRDPNFRRYALFNCWLMLGSGITQPAFQLYLKNQLGVSLIVPGVFQAINQLFAILGLRLAGPLTDRFGNKPVIILGLAGAATGPFFWLPASPDSYWCIALAYVVWGFGWAGVNLGAQNLMLKCAPQSNNVAYIAAAQGLGGFCLASTVILGGWLLDRLEAANFSLQLGPAVLGAYHIFFLLSFLGRSSAVLWVFGIRETGASTVRRMVRVLLRARRARSRGWRVEGRR